jgi:hypothetical protein
MVSTVDVLKSSVNSIYINAPTVEAKAPFSTRLNFRFPEGWEVECEVDLQCQSYSVA